MAINLTNKHNLPETFVNACLIDNHVTRGDISVTQLIDAPQIRYLKRNNDYEEDVMDRIWALMGTAVHYILELSEIEYSEARYMMECYGALIKHGNEGLAKELLSFVEEKFPRFKDPDVFLEKTMSIEIDGMTISGTMDKFTQSTGVLEDYKNCSTWAYINEESKKKWYAQQNIYAYMLRQNGHTVNKSIINAIFRDFSKSAGLRNKDYPKNPIEIIDIKLYDDDFMKNYLKKRVQLHRNADEGNVAECTGKERWSKPDQFAVKQKGRKNAVRVLSSQKALDEWMTANSFKYDNLSVEKRPGSNGRCENYCSVSSICPQFKKIMQEKAEDNNDF